MAGLVIPLSQLKQVLSGSGMGGRGRAEQQAWSPGSWTTELGCPRRGAGLVPRPPDEGQQSSSSSLGSWSVPAPPGFSGECVERNKGNAFPLSI